MQIIVKFVIMEILVADVLVLLQAWKVIIVIVLKLLLIANVQQVSISYRIEFVKIA